MECTSLQLDIRKQVSQHGPNCFLEVEGYPLRCRRCWKYLEQLFEDLSVVFLVLPRHYDAQEGHLLGVIILFYEGVHGEELGEGRSAEFEGAVHVPVLCLGEVL